MLPYGSLEVRVTSTSVRGFLRTARGYKAVVDPKDEVIFLDNCISRFDDMIRSLVQVNIDRTLAMPRNMSPIPMEAHDTACVLTWPDWFAEAAPFAKLTLLIDWRRSLLEQRHTAATRSPEPKAMPLALLEQQRKAARERKMRSRERQRAAAKLAGTWRPPGRPRKSVR